MEKLGERPYFSLFENPMFYFTVTSYNIHNLRLMETELEGPFDSLEELVGSANSRFDEDFTVTVAILVRGAKELHLFHSQFLFEHGLNPNWFPDSLEENVPNCGKRVLITSNDVANLREKFDGQIQNS